MAAMTAQFCATVTMMFKTTATSQAGCKSRAAHARLNRDGAAAPQRAPRTHHPLRAGVTGCLDLLGSVCGAASRVAAPAQPEGHGSAGRIRPRAGQVVKTLSHLFRTGPVTFALDQGQAQGARGKRITKLNFGGIPR